MTDSTPKIVPTTRPLRPELREALTKLKPGQRIKIRHTIRIGNLSWPAEITGTFRSLRCLVTGLATERVRQDDIIVPTVHFTKDNGELSSITLDENCLIDILE